MYHGAVSVIILIAGVAGLAVAAWGFFTLTLDAVRTRHYLDVVVAAAVAVGAIAALVLWGDRFLR